MNYRRKDYVIPRSMKEAYGYDDNYEPEIRCCSESFYRRQPRPVWPLIVCIVVLIFAALQLVKVYGW